MPAETMFHCSIRIRSYLYPYGARLPPLLRGPSELFAIPRAVEKDNLIIGSEFASYGKEDYHGSAE